MKIFKNTTILGTHDFVNPSSDIYGEHNHGMKVLSCMAVNTPHVMVGTAPEASYWLLRSEDNDTEQPVEERQLGCGSGICRTVWEWILLIPP